MVEDVLLVSGLNLGSVSCKASALVLWAQALWQSLCPAVVVSAGIEVMCLSWERASRERPSRIWDVAFGIWDLGFGPG